MRNATLLILALLILAPNHGAAEPENPHGIYDDFQSRVLGMADLIPEGRIVLTEARCRDSHPDWKNYQPFLRLGVIQQPGEMDIVFCWYHHGGFVDGRTEEDDPRSVSWYVPHTFYLNEAGRDFFGAHHDR